MTKSKTIREYKEANPTAKAKDIAKACGVATAYVYQVLHNAKKPKKTKAVKAVQPTTPTEGQKIVRKELDRLNAEADGWRDLYLSTLDELEQLHSDAIGYRAVISYLQGQLNGATV